MITNKLFKFVSKYNNSLVGLTNRSVHIRNSNILVQQKVRYFSTDNGGGNNNKDDFAEILEVIKRIDNGFKKDTPSSKATSTPSDNKTTSFTEKEKKDSVNKTAAEEGNTKNESENISASVTGEVESTNDTISNLIGNKNNGIIVSKVQITDKDLATLLQKIKDNNSSSNSGESNTEGTTDKGKSTIGPGEVFKIQDLMKPQKPTSMQESKYKVVLSEDLIGCDDNLLPRDIQQQLDRFIIGQGSAKRAVAIALRNRWRRKRLEGSIKSDVYPKNILMVGPTGVGKTEIARRLAKIINAPFVKVEATKYTEVGFHGADVDTMIRDLVEVAINNIKAKIANSHRENIEAEVENEIILALVGPMKKPADEVLKMYREKQLENIEIEIDFSGSSQNHVSPSDLKNLSEDDNPFFKLFSEKPSQPKKKRCTVSEARQILEKSHKEKMVTGNAEITRMAIQQAEQNGIVFIDEIDKICTPKESSYHGSDASTDGVQRDLLPIIEGSNVNTKYGMVDTSRILFIASGAFHSCKPSDLISELQGRLPIRVELKPLDQNDFYRILTEPDNNQIQQQQALLKTEDINLQFTAEALQEISKIAFEANAQDLNIGARRLHGIIEKIVEEISFNCDHHSGKTVILDKDDVKTHLKDLLVKTDLSKYII
ncbi:Heat shock protein HslVU [Tieghemostelium lacteum]|uniref:Heat shock protein HslVU n=1 Tax=Tieghemostelium lacteum TaxID=361077 RepID=A0A151ZBV3_TIELA|nr:Heat shock protein HslVU [Tieghemostelium lacteum]|eukprot:KYQ91405.1 Heat shock protein HslVU [Tieghemostelium lacteum]